MSEDILARIAALDVPEAPFAARARFLHGNALYLLDRNEDAIRAFREAEELAATEGDARTRAMAVLRQCQWGVVLRRWHVARSKLAAACAETRALGDPWLHASAEIAAANVANEDQDWSEMERRFDFAAVLLRNTRPLAPWIAAVDGDGFDLADQCARSARTAWYRGAIAREEFDQAHREAEQRAELAVYADALGRAAAAGVEDPQRALELWDRAIAMGQLPPADVASAHLNRGYCRELLGDHAGARGDAMVAAQEVSAPSDVRAQARANYLSSRVHTEAEVPLNEEEGHLLFGDDLLLAGAEPSIVHHARAYYHMRRGNYEAALVETERHEAALRAPSDTDCSWWYEKPENLAGTASTKAWLLSTLGRHADAARVCREAIEKLPQDAPKVPFIAAALLFRKGSIHENVGELEEAHGAYSTAAKLFSESGESSWGRRCRLCAIRVGVHVPVEDRRAEIDALVQELARFGPPSVLPEALCTRASLNDAPDDALRAAEGYVRVDEPLAAAGAYDEAALLFARSGRVANAVDASRRSARILDEILAVAPDDENRVGVQSRMKYVRTRLVEFLFERTPKHALEEALRTKSSALLHLLRQRFEVAVQHPPLGGLLAPAVERPFASVGPVAVRSAPPIMPSVPLARVRELYRELTRDRVSRKLTEELDVSVDAIVDSLPSDGALLEVLPTSEWIYVFAIARKEVRAVRAELTPAVEEDRDAVMRELRAPVTLGRMHGRRSRGALRRLHSTLFGDLGGMLSGISRLWISPGAELASLPWPALIEPDGAALLDRFELTMLLSGAQLSTKSQRRSGGGIAVVRGYDGERPLRSADIEVDAVTRSFRSHGWPVERLGADVARIDVEAAITRAAVFHFAGHAGFDDREGMAAHLATPGAPLVAAEILGLDLRSVRLAVLSACETGRVQTTTGDEFVGLLRALFASGCSTVLASRWLADDAATAALMIDIYGQWLAGKRLAACLRDAQLRLRDQGFSAPLPPYFWANFAIYGPE